MKNISTIFSSLALLGVIVLFAMKMNEKKAVKPKVITKDAAGKEVVLAAGKIAYVDIDTLEAHYDYFKKKKVEFEVRQKNIDADLEKMANSLRNEVVAFQKKAQNGELTEAQGQAAQQELLKKEQELELKRQNLGAKYMKDQDAFNKEIHDNLHDYIEIFNEEKGYDYILSYSKESSILFANKELDVTQEIIDGMNNASSKSKKASK
ncbi:MAG: OmpH family outer membrane protein [Bacteroidetes bacterium]|nr:OmpH family outer membrane protein [Bacteroidota bacterium]MBK8146117.1 OmpH family outer membrane protein [Bacteroidota bacterium]MBP6313893.1 OmpH family outer membrane protein [Chitinophagaceae bacterium]